MDRKIHEAYLKQQEELSATLDQRRTAREKLAAEAKEYQIKQMKERSNEFNSLQRKQMLADECERKRLEHVDAMARKTMQE